MIPSICIADPVIEDQPGAKWNNVSQSAFRFLEVQQKLALLESLMREAEQEHMSCPPTQTCDLIQKLFNVVAKAGVP